MSDSPPPNQPTTGELLDIIEELTRAIMRLHLTTLAMQQGEKEDAIFDKHIDTFEKVNAVRNAIRKLRGQPPINEDELSSGEIEAPI